MRNLSTSISALCAVCLGAASYSPISAADPLSSTFTIASKGHPNAEIIIASENPEPPLTFAAQELQRYVKELSGAELPISHATSNKPSIILTCEPSPNEDRYRLNINNIHLHITGATPRAVLFGVYDVLERLGCGWCVPGDDTVPKRDTLELPALTLDTRPAFKDRMMLDFPLMSTEQSIAIVDWLAKNRMNWVRACANAHGEPTNWYQRRERVVPELKKRGIHLIVGGHTMHTWVHETEFANHPAWFALEDGKRKPPTLCVTNAEATAEVVRNMRRFLDKCPEADVVDLWHTDGVTFCHCAKCTRGVYTETPNSKPPTTMPTSMPADAVQSAYVISYIEFINRVANEIAGSHPKVMISPLVYSQADRAMPDACPALADNVLLGLAHFYRDSYRPLKGEPKSAINLRFLGDDLTWIAKAKHHYIYEYYNCWIAPYVYPGAQVIAEDIRTLQQLEIPSVSSDMFGYSPINMYVAARALWSPGIDWKDAVRDFCDRYYADISKEMAENELQLIAGIYSKNGYQCNGARGDPKLWPDIPAAGVYLNQQRPKQITFLKEMIAKTKNPQVKARLERALKPWSEWNEKPRFWAFPDFKPDN